MALSHTIKRILPSTFQIQLWAPDNKNAVIGTGFAVSGHGYIVTANHVVKTLEEKVVPPNSTLKVGFAGPDYESAEITVRASFSVFDCEVVASNEDDDIALLKTARPLDEIDFTMHIMGQDNTTEAKPCVLDLRRPFAGENIAISGYPLSEPALVTTTGIIASNWTLYKGSERYLGDITANPGNSGGPVYMTTSGKVIGVCVAGKVTPVLEAGAPSRELVHSAGLTYIVPSQAIIRLIESNNLSSILN